MVMEVVTKVVRYGTTGRKEGKEEGEVEESVALIDSGGNV